MRLLLYLLVAFVDADIKNCRICGDNGIFELAAENSNLALKSSAQLDGVICRSRRTLAFVLCNTSCIRIIHQTNTGTKLEYQDCSDGILLHGPDGNNYSNGSHDVMSLKSSDGHWIYNFHNQTVTDSDDYSAEVEGDESGSKEDYITNPDDNEKVIHLEMNQHPECVTQNCDTSTRDNNGTESTFESLADVFFDNFSAVLFVIGFFLVGWCLYFLSSKVLFNNVKNRVWMPLGQKSTSNLSPSLTV